LRLKEQMEFHGTWYEPAATSGENLQNF